MTTKVYLLVETSVGKTRGVASALQDMTCIESVDVVTGPYDIVAVIEGPDMGSVGNLITGKIHSVEGVVRTVTCVAVTNGKVLAERT